ncbi:hypothetical protein DF3PB_5830002 [uncultured Defluviicoccus sp.]|uniref:Uncharacterized protein n=1 Tax=metagenome TaxID=256318 RepID=A0A380TIY0_9ZZZZ|nr:hypothetical protein DF3PB_5830002 [uncultured Defluviicoccus sp.]
MSFNEYLYAYANPGAYVDPDGRAGFLTELRDRFDRTDAILRQNAVDSEGSAGLLGYSLLRGLAAAGSAIPRALNVASDAVAQALPGETFGGVRADGAAEFGNVVDTGAYVVANPGQVVRDIHGNAVQTTVALAEGDRGSASDAISFFGQMGGGAAAGRVLGFGAGAAPHAPKVVFEGANGHPATRFLDPAMVEDLEDAYRAAGRYSSESSRPEWLRAKLEAGEDFNRRQRVKFKYNEVYVENACDGGSCLRLDSYRPPGDGGGSGEIVSRKFTQLAEIQPETASKYLREMERKYAPGTMIADVPTTRASGLAGQRLRGQMYLDVPTQNAPVPQSILDEAAERRIIIRDELGNEL